MMKWLIAWKSLSWPKKVRIKLDFEFEVISDSKA